MSAAAPVASRVGPMATPDRLRAVAALACAAAAGVHAGLVPTHPNESTILGVAFAIDAVLLGISALVVSDRSRGIRGTSMVAGILAATVVAYLLSRTSGLPFLIAEPEPFDSLGAITTLIELVGLGACLGLIQRRDLR